MNSVFVIKRDVDVNGNPLSEAQLPLYGFWAGKNGGGWAWASVAAKYETRKHAEAAMKRNAKTEWSFRKGYAYIVEVQL